MTALCPHQKMARIFWARRRAAGRGGGREALPGCPWWVGLPSLGSSLFSLILIIYYKIGIIGFLYKKTLFYILLSYSIENKSSISRAGFLAILT